MMALDSTGLADAARDFLICRTRGDYDAAVALLADDAVWHSPIHGAVPRPCGDPRDAGRRRA